jgi:hypothetical protein
MYEIHMSTGGYYIKWPDGLVTNCTAEQAGRVMYLLSQLAKR